MSEWLYLMVSEHKKFLDGLSIGTFSAWKSLKPAFPDPLEPLMPPQFDPIAATDDSIDLVAVEKPQRLAEPALKQSRTFIGTHPYVDI